jgi:hypothetical protein
MASKALRGVTRPEPGKGRGGQRQFGRAEKGNGARSSGGGGDGGSVGIGAWAGMLVNERVISGIQPANCYRARQRKEKWVV